MSFFSTTLRRLSATNACVICVLLAGCGGGGGGGSTDPGTSQPNATALQVISTGVGSNGQPTGSIVDGVLNVDPSVSLLVNFNEAINPTTVASGSFVLIGNGASVAISVTAGTTSATIVPTSPLAVGTHYKLTVKAGIGAQNGTVLASDYMVGFTTAPVAFRSVVLADPDRQLLAGSPQLVATGDLNGDGRVDVVQLGSLPASMPGSTQGYSLRLFTQSADGTFTLLQEIDTVTSTDPYLMTFPKVFVSDIDGDGVPEILVPEFTLEGLKGTNPGTQVSGIRIYKRNANGLYASASFVQTNYTQSMTILDVDGDGRPDFIGTSIYQPGFQVIFNTGTGLSPSAAVSDVNCLCEFAIADLNHDGKRQLIVDNVGQVLLTTFAPIPPSISVYSVGASGQVTPDAALTQLLSNVCSGFYTCSSMVVLDINGDGLPDLLFADSTTLTGGGGGAVPYFRRTGGGYTQGTPFSLGVNRPVVVPVDVNGDGVIDLVVIDTVTGVNIAAVLFTQGGNTFRFSPAYVIPEEESLVPGAVAIADINGDGLPDIVLVGQNEGVTAMLQVK